MEVDKSSTVYNDDETLSGIIMDVVDEAQKILTSLEHEDNPLDVNQNLNDSIIIAYRMADPNDSTHRELDSINNGSIVQMEQSSTVLTDAEIVIEYLDTDSEVNNSTNLINPSSSIRLFEQDENTTATTEPAIQTTPKKKRLLHEIYEIDTDTTKTGEVRKRRKFKLNPKERQDRKEEILKSLREVLPGCGENCRRKCNDYLSENRRSVINQDFHNMTNIEKKNFLLLSTRRTAKVHETVNADSRRSNSVAYFFKLDNGDHRQVCRSFFLTTLGYKKNNDRIIQNLSTGPKYCIKAKPDGRKGKIPSNTIKDNETVIDHIKSFKPNISHYRRSHAPQRLYLPSDLSAQKMYDHFVQKYGNVCSYDHYRKNIRNMNISFVQLGHEECECCEHFKIHGHTEDDMDNDCNECNSWISHKRAATQARTEYDKDAKLQNEDDCAIYSVDLQKVIMLPRCDMFKSVLFIKRLTTYNESFVPVGKPNQTNHTAAALWHEAISGRKKEDIVSTYHKFFMLHRDDKSITLWVDNCTSQNKNWTFFSFLMFMVNSQKSNLQELRIKYFEPGHTFMSADSFHHRVEKELKSMKKVYDFDDFKKCVTNASKKIDILEMKVEDFYEWQDLSSMYVLKNTKCNSERPYVKDFCEVRVERGNWTLLYKTTFEETEYKIANFLKKKIIKEGIPEPKMKEKPNGIPQEKKQALIKNLILSSNGIIPKYRIKFWQDLPISETDADNDISDREN